MVQASIGFTAAETFRTISGFTNAPDSPARFAARRFSAPLSGSALPITAPIAKTTLRKYDPMNLFLFVILAVVLVVAGFILALLVIPLLGLEDKSTKLPAYRDASSETSKTVTLPRVETRTLRIWSDPQKDKLVVEIDGRAYDVVTELSQEQRRFLSTTATELVAWMSQAVLEPGLPAPVEQQLRLSSSIDMLPIEPKPAPADRSVINAFLQALQPGGSKGRPQPKSLAAQIDEILQEKLALTGFSQHTIHLAELPNYGMSVQVDREQYESVDSVPDEEIRKLIREAVEEWQRRSKLGRP